MSHRVVIAGAGYFAAHQLQAWQDLGVQRVGLCDPEAAKADALALAVWVLSQPPQP